MKTNKQFVYERNHISTMKRLRIKESRDLINGIRMNRNERVDDFEKNIFSKIFSKTKSYNLSKYPDHSNLYSKLKIFLKVDEKNFILTSGIDGSLKSIFEIFLKKGDSIGCLLPSYAMYEVFSKIYNIKLLKISYDKDNYRLNKKELFSSISKVKILFIPNPNQPIEDNLSLSELEKICKICEKNKTLLVIDEAYHMFGSNTAASLIKKFKNLLVLRTFSKAFGVPSIRLGYAIGPENLISILNTYRLSYETNFLSEEVIQYFLKNLGAVKKYINNVKNGRDYFKSELNKLGISSFGKNSNFVLIKLNNKNMANKLYEFLLKKKIYVKGKYPGFLSDCLLLTCAKKNTMMKIISQIKIFLKK